jgi:hypothetical protein
MSSTAGVISSDHLDLLVTAAVRYRVLVSPTTAAFSPAVESAITPATPTEAGRLLLEQNLAAIRWKTSRTRIEDTLLDEQITYEYRPVEDYFEPVEVIKAAHCYQHLTAGGPIWDGSAAQRLLSAIVHAATQWLPGYAAAAWEWTRPARRTGQPIGLCRQWVPVERGVRWVGPAELEQEWDTAALVLVTLEALDDIPVGLDPRPGVYVCTGTRVDTDAWAAIERLHADIVVMLPAGRGWLLEQLRQPTTAYRRSALHPPAVLPVA